MTRFATLRRPDSPTAANWSAPRPTSPANIRRTIKSLLASSLIIALGILAACAVAWTVASALEGRDLGPLAGLTAALLLAVIMLSMQLRRQTKAIRPVNGVPVCIQTCGRRLVELSCFGAGALRRWTTTNEAVGLGRIVIPDPLQSHPPDSEPADGEDPMRVEFATDPARRRPISHTNRRLAANREQSGGTRSGVRRRFSRTVADATPDLPETVDLTAGPTVSYRVQRGDTYWSLAERHLGDGRRWKAIQDLNLGRRVGPGITLTETDTLRRGWQILVPVSKADGTNDR